ncbi:Uncharacterised protein [Mycobacteroides abscessus subsp. abscessus]|nr:Uncharacterised protein [Mycobacteroides abscessus subsp. abscessus]SIK72325.1 Uncharacterised protein [Mycobacteroides abscessus subsp. abscessus]SKU22253.1 Uncharacterised protein [Mycobacteroides abscessus subsp. abscessus]
MASANPAAAPSAKNAKATALTDAGDASREPTSRSGPTLSSSVPRMPSE